MQQVLLDLALQNFLERGDDVVGFDNVNDYYDPALKEARLQVLAETAEQVQQSLFLSERTLQAKATVDQCFKDHQFDRVIHLAAQAGVRYSLENPLICRK